MVLFWCAVAALFFLIELGNPGLLFCLSFACGAVVALTVALVDADNFLAQGISFFVGTVVAFCILRSLVKKVLHEHTHRTNVDALQGCRGIVITDITPTQAGSVKVGGQIWTAASVHNEYICRNTPVEVVFVRGVHLMVLPVIVK